MSPPTFQRSERYSLHSAGPFVCTIKLALITELFSVCFFASSFHNYHRYDDTEWFRIMVMSARERYRATPTDLCDDHLDHAQFRPPAGAARNTLCWIFHTTLTSLKIFRLAVWDKMSRDKPSCHMPVFVVIEEITRWQFYMIMFSLS